MKRIFHPYYLWEDWKAGMFKKKINENEEKLSKQARELLSNENEFFKVAYKVIKEWKYSSEHNLTNKSRNRQAWLGQASCCYKLGVPEYITKYGWRLLDLGQQNKANKIADKVIKIWEKENDEKVIKNKCITSF
jgi:vacuolar-type H+-ATPase catalytic subunit A/Vma1|tara:strand:- start:2925 stop:3326 length:402 start_codon:yes stop_codon:yes gene_type:complete